MTQVGFEPTIPVLDLAKIFLAVSSGKTVSGRTFIFRKKERLSVRKEQLSKSPE
jgi:hypothetical protein